MKKLLLILTLFISFFLGAAGQDVKITAAFDTTAIYIGDQIHYTITVVKPTDLLLALKPISDTLVKNIEIVSGPAGDTVKLPDNKIKITRKYLVTSFDSGFYQVPPMFAELKDENGIKRFYSDYSPLAVMRVKLTPPDTTAKIFDIIKPYRAPLTFGEILPWIIIAFVAAAVVWGIVIVLRRFRKKNGAPEIAINPDPAHITAFRELEKLRQEELWQKGEIKLYYTRLTEILRQYLENRYGVCSLEMTTHETLEALVKTGFRRDDSFNLLRNILTGSDLVKFAKYIPEAPEHEEHFQNSWKFVENTKKMEEPVTNEGSGSKEVVS